MNNTQREYNRRTARLQNYDYAQPGFYFITICTHEKKWMFGEVVNDEMHLNDVGKIIQLTWNTLPKRFLQVELDEYVIMPNHLHGIIIIEGPCADTRKISNSSKVPERFQRYMHANGVAVPTSALPSHPGGRDKSGPYDASRLPYAPALGEIVRTFKAVSTREIRLSGKPNFAWQTNYYEHIIRNDKDLDRIRQYIVNNPASWAEDSLNIKEGSLL